MVVSNEQRRKRRTLSGLLLLLGLEPSTSRSGHNLVSVLDHVLSLSDLHVGRSKLQIKCQMISSRSDSLSTEAKKTTNSFLLLLFSKDSGDLVLERLEVDSHFADGFWRDDSMTDLIRWRRLDGCFEHLSIGFSDEGDGSTQDRNE